MSHEYSDWNGLGIGKTNKSLFEEVLGKFSSLFKSKVWGCGPAREGGSFKDRQGGWDWLELPEKSEGAGLLLSPDNSFLFGRRLEKETAFESTTSPEKTHEGLIGFLAAVFRLAQMYSHQSLIEGKRRSAGLLSPCD